MCTANGHYDMIDLELIPDDYLPRTTYTPHVDRHEYVSRVPRVGWDSGGEDWRRQAIADFLSRCGPPATAVCLANERLLPRDLLRQEQPHPHRLFSDASSAESVILLVAAVCGQVLRSISW